MSGPDHSKEDGVVGPADRAEQRGSGGVIGWVKGKIQKRNLAATMNNLDLDEAEKNALAAEAATGEPSDLDIAMGLGTGGVVDAAADEVPDEDKIDLDAENDEGLLVGWGKKLQEVEWVQKTVQVVQEGVANRQEQEELREIHETYKEEIKKDKDIKELQKKIKKLRKNLKVQRLNGDRIAKKHSFQRDKEQENLDKKTARLKKSIWTFSNSSMNSHEYAKAMMRASGRLQRKGIKVHKSEKALAMEAAVLRNMHRMLTIQKQYTMAKKSCNEISSFVKRCKGWLDNKLADGEMGIMVLEATSKSMGIMYAETLEVQLALIPKLEDPASHTFGKQRLKTVLALPKGLRSMPTFLKGPSRPPMKISLKKQVEEEDPNLKGYRTFKEQAKALDEAWKEEMKQYENQLVVGGADMKIFDDVSDLGDSEDEIEENLAAVSVGAAAAKKVAPAMDMEELIKKQKAAEREDLGENEDEPAPETTATETETGEAPETAEPKMKGDSDEGDPEEEKKAENKADGDENVSLNTGGVSPTKGGVTFDDSKKSVESEPIPTESAEEADAAALEKAAKDGDLENDPDVDEAALPEEVKQEDLDDLLDKEAEEVTPSLEEEAEADNAVEEALHQVVEDALEGVGAEIEESDSNDDDDAEPAKTKTPNGDATAVSDDASC
ncbi:expressed unknown protein [Seminavis robusta]|uniref:Uncharacterized protein n=1 Tax=Seminavis robusta TaxID=568900 RepID=A0A9N8ENM7_9STRA|nr:expressed unknown protein [Seminavis robusta]|eukprot:Sro1401_g269470.1 n/a (666) ;mRNA; f:16871-18868